MRLASFCEGCVWYVSPAQLMAIPPGGDASLHLPVGLQMVPPATARQVGEVIVG